MKDNLNIEELFKSKFNSFEGEVSPDAWTNIQQGMSAAKVGAATSAGKAGMSTFLKAAIFSGSVIAVTTAAIYMFSDDSKIEATENNVLVEEASNLNNKEEANSETLPVIQLQDQNDPVVEENREDLEREILDNRVAQEAIDLENTIPVISENVEQEDDITNEVVNNTEVEDDITNEVANNSDETTTIDEDSNGNSEVTAPEKDYPTGKMTFLTGNEFSPASYEFKANAKNFKNVKWTFGDGTTGEGNEVSHTYTKPGRYEVRMTVIGKSDVYEETQVIEIQSKASIDNIPNVITPNGDRMNDFFVISSTEIETFYITIRDAKGNVVFESSDANFRWYGTDAGGNALEKARYTYMIFAEGTDGSEFNIPGELYIK